MSLFEKRKIENFNNLYIDENNIFYKKTKEKFIQVNLHKNKNGYITCRIDNRKRNYHRIIAEIYINNPNNYKCVNHINGIKSDNRIENLEWCTHSMNNQHAYDIGLKIKGENHVSSKLSDNEVKKIRELYENEKISQYKLADMFNVHQVHIGRIINNKRRKK